MTKQKSPVIVALDFPVPAQAEQLLEQLDPAACRVKIGKELFTRSGPALVRSAVDRGFEVFLDLKFHDIPNTVAAAVAAAADLGVWMVNVHATGGPRMLRAAREAIAPLGSNAPLLTAVTVLTSMTGEELHAVGVTDTAEEQVLRLARLSLDCGLDGVVCSAREVSMLRSELGQGAVLVTPGIRPAGSVADDQRRTATPAAALAAGSSYLVIGRPITRSEDPAGALATINRELVSFYSQ